MSKPYIHSLSSARKYGGIPEDYFKIHEWFDQTKAFLPDQRHRALLHSSFGIFLCAQVFGDTITNSDNKVVSVRDLGEQHVLEDFGGKFIPTPQDYLQEIDYQPWMQNGKGYPPSFQKVNEKRVKEKKERAASELIVDGSRPAYELLKFNPKTDSAMEAVIDGHGGLSPFSEVTLKPFRELSEKDQLDLFNYDGGMPAKLDSFKSGYCSILDLENKKTITEEEVLKALDKKYEPIVTPFKQFDGSIINTAVYDGSIKHNHLVKDGDGPKPVENPAEEPAFDDISNKPGNTVD